MAADLQAQTVVDALADAIRQHMLSRSLQAGARVTEQDIASLFGVARPTAKAAIERLVQTGMLRRSANKTAQVPILTSKDIKDIYRSRIFFERDVVGELAELGTVPAQAERALNEMASAMRNNSPGERVKWDVVFHRALVDGLASERLSRMYDTIADEAYLCVAQEINRTDPTATVAEHHAILAAIRKRDPILARDLLSSHLQRAETRLLGAFADPSE